MTSSLKKRIERIEKQVAKANSGKTTWLKEKSKSEVLEFIKKRLSFSCELKSQIRHIDTDAFGMEHRRFQMDGYDIDGEPGQCVKFNLDIVNEFADLGIYDYTNYLFLDFYKGAGILHFQDFMKGCEIDEHKSLDLGGIGTIEIIYEIFLVTILSNKRARRR